jgi:5-methylcytosine-specific restriction endonuclease McrA
MPRSRASEVEHPAYDPSAEGPDGRALCRWCIAQLPPRRIMFCSPACRHEFMLRRSQSYLRQHVFARDQGICCQCRLDGGSLDRIIACMRGHDDQGQRDDAAALWALEGLGFGRRRRVTSVWNMDHRIAVAEGGGSCGMGNVRTLCLTCHKAETRALHRRMVVERSDFR